MSLTVVMPVRDEMPFIRAWCECVGRFADQVIVADTGSTDGTTEILEQYDFQLLHWPGHKDRFGGSEAQVRNQLLDLARCPWIFRLDADELVGDDFIAWKETIGDYAGKKFLWLQDYMFWRSIQFIRSRQFDRTLGDTFRFHPRYYPFITANDPHIRYRDIHSDYWFPQLEYRRMGHFSPRWKRAKVDVPVFHMHYVQGKPMGYREKELCESGIRATTYLGPYPREMQYYRWLTEDQR